MVNFGLTFRFSDSNHNYCKHNYLASKIVIKVYIALPQQSIYPYFLPSDSPHHLKAIFHIINRFVSTQIC